MATVDGITKDVTGSSWTETAYEWLQRSIQQEARDAVVRDPSSAAWAFVRRPNTGVSFVDAALKRRQVSDNLPVVMLRGNEGTGKTSALLTLAARFVVDTCPARFHARFTPSPLLPQVVLIDGNQHLTPNRIACTVRSVLLLNHKDIEHNNLQDRLRSCMERIHVIFSGGVSCTGWVATLESLRHKLSETSDHPTLVLWDGFLSDLSDRVERTEMVRQFSRLLRDCNIFTIVACANNMWIPGGFDALVTHRIGLEHNMSPTPEAGGHEYSATVDGQGNRTHYSLSLGGILS